MEEYEDLVFTTEKLKYWQMALRKRLSDNLVPQDHLTMFLKDILLGSQELLLKGASCSNNAPDMLMRLKATAESILLIMEVLLIDPPEESELHKYNQEEIEDSVKVDKVLSLTLLSSIVSSFYLHVYTTLSTEEAYNIKDLFVKDEDFEEVTMDYLKDILAAILMVASFYEVVSLTELRLLPNE